LHAYILYKEKRGLLGEKLFPLNKLIKASTMLFFLTQIKEAALGFVLAHISECKVFLTVSINSGTILKIFCWL
jgi:hypothetical protein